MKREEKNALSRQRILDAAMAEFARRGYEGASLSTACAENGISKGIVYHYFRDKDELYLLCVEHCFHAMTEYLQTAVGTSSGPARSRLRDYFDARLRFFAERPLCHGIFADAALHPPAHLSTQITERRRDFDAYSISLLTELLNSAPLRRGLSVETVVEDFRMYMDYFNIHFRSTLQPGQSPQASLQEHEERCHRQLDILLYGVLGEDHEP